MYQKHTNTLYPAGNGKETSLPLKLAFMKENKKHHIGSWPSDLSHGSAAKVYITMVDQTYKNSIQCWVTSQALAEGILSTSESSLAQASHNSHMIKIQVMLICKVLRSKNQEGVQSRIRWIKALDSKIISQKTQKKIKMIKE